MKKIKRIIVALIIIFSLNKNVYASSISINSSANSINKGNSVTITATINADSGIYTTSGSVYCTGAGVENGIDLSYEDLNTDKKSFSRNISITPTSGGTLTCKTSNVKIRELSKESEYNLEDKSISITVTNNNSSGTTGTTNETKKEVKEKSSDNTLKSLSVENYKISPDFKKDTTEYKLEVDEKVDKIKINATASDEKATINGLGEKQLTPGNNTIEIKVNAENGNEKTYKLIVTVKDQNPITVKINNKNYTIIKINNNILNKPDNYEEETIKIKDQDVISYINKKTKVRLVILKDENNKPGYYIYREKSNTYTKYQSITVGNVTLQILTPPKTLTKYKKYKIKLKDEQIDIYKIKKTNKYGLIYGTNIKTGDTNYYIYDEEEETLSRYYNEEAKALRREIQDLKNREMLFIGIAAAITIVSIMISIITVVNRKKRVHRH